MRQIYEDFQSAIQIQKSIDSNMLTEISDQEPKTDRNSKWINLMDSSCKNRDLNDENENSISKIDTPKSQLPKRSLIVGI
jgi:hypothetical protein